LPPVSTPGVGMPVPKVPPVRLSVIVSGEAYAELHSKHANRIDL